MAAQALMKRGKRPVATYFKAECARAAGQQQLNVLLDYLLDINGSLDDPERLDWCRWLVAGGLTFEEFGRIGLILKMSKNTNNNSRKLNPT